MVEKTSVTRKSAGSFALCESVATAITTKKRQAETEINHTLGY